MTVRRAKAGGETVGGKFFKGGQFIGAEWLARENGGLQQFGEKIQAATNRAVYNNIRQAAFSIRKYIRESIKESNEPGRPGKPVTTRKRAGNVRDSIWVAAEQYSAIIGPRYSFVADTMQTHEFGGTRYGRRYPARPTSGPALEANADRFGGLFRGSIGE